MIEFVEFLKVPASWALVIIGIIFVMNVIGEICEFKGKVVPEFMKIRKSFLQKKNEKKDTAQTLKDVMQLLNEVNAHYSADNITKRETWMCWVNERAKVYDESIVEITKNLADATDALKENTKLTEEMFIQNSRDRIIDFATKVADERTPVSREEFNRIFKVYEDYEKFLEERGLTNGEVAIAYRIVKESYEYHMKHHSFIEDVRGY